MKNVVTQYYSVAANQNSQSLDWNQDLNLICYGADNSLTLLDTVERRLIGTCDVPHKGKVCCVKWAKYDNQHIVVTSDSAGYINVWNMLEKTSSNIEICLQLFHSEKFYSEAINVMNVWMSKDHELWVAAACNETLRCWGLTFCNKTVQEKCIFKLPYHAMVLDIQIMSLDKFLQCESHPLIIYCGDDNKVHLLSVSDNVCTKVGLLPGHEDWAFTIDYTTDDNGDLLIASGSKDGVIRLWRISRQSSSGKSEEVALDDIQLRFPTKDSYVDCFCSLESVLHGHQGLVSQVQWRRNQNNILQLLSCAKTEDRSIIIWEQNKDDADNTLWIENTRLGEVGGNREGFLIASFASLSQIVAVSYQGGIHMWEKGDCWQAVSVVGGHFNEVTDLDWHNEGRYLITVSKDQTARIHCKINCAKLILWQEISRPQVHGYDMCCVSHLPGFKFVSGAEEYVVRGFGGTLDFVKKLDELTGSSFAESLVKDSSVIAERASVPSLGLSNKAIDNEEFFSFAQMETSGPPNEDQLMMGTLWPEICKLYGHGNELLSLSCSHDGKLVASSCRATNEIDASIILWDTLTWTKIDSLVKHRLSVVQLAFSKCDQHLLSVSRDRSWCIHSQGNDGKFRPTFSSSQLPKSQQHSRIIWSCDWLPFGLKFVTGSRDKKLMVWSPSEDGWLRSCVMEETDEVTAVTSCSYGHSKIEVIIAIGTENGHIIVRLYNTERNEFTKSIDIRYHKKAVRRLKFQPNPPGTSVTLASCGSDNAVFIHNISL